MKSSAVAGSSELFIGFLSRASLQLSSVMMMMMMMIRVWVRLTFVSFVFFFYEALPHHYHHHQLYHQLILQTSSTRGRR